MKRIYRPLAPKPPLKKVQLNWWEDPTEEFEIPLGYPIEDNNDAVDIYEKRRKYWWELKIEQDIKLGKDFIRICLEHQQYDEFSIKNGVDLSKVETKLLPVQKTPKKMTLVLDMDETLVNCSLSEQYEYDTKVVGNIHGIHHNYYISFRPYLFEFLKDLHEIYEIVVFTAGEISYAGEIINAIDPEKEFIDHGLYRNSCEAMGKTYIKDISNLGRPGSKTIIVDNFVFSFAHNLDNGIPVIDYFGDKNDVELKYLKEDLKQIYTLVTQSLNPFNNDVRNILRRKYKVKQRIREMLLEENVPTNQPLRSVSN